MSAQAGIVARARRFWQKCQRQPRALRRPYVMAVAHRRAPDVFGARVLHRLTAAPPSALRAYLDEVDEIGILDHLEDAATEYFRCSVTRATGAVLVDEGRVLYAALRALRPDTVVETGTANGVSTTFILAALEQNQAGRLVSIDLPFVERRGEVQALLAGTEMLLPWDQTPLPEGKEPGWMVPDALRHRWELRLGDARALLPQVLRDCGPLGLFFHDSLHTREHMLFEFETAWPHLGEGAILAADDVFYAGHAALPAFAASVGRPFVTFSALGFVRK